MGGGFDVEKVGETDLSVDAKWWYVKGNRVWFWRVEVNEKRGYCVCVCVSYSTISIPQGMNDSSNCYCCLNNYIIQMAEDAATDATAITTTTTIIKWQKQQWRLRQWWASSLPLFFPLLQPQLLLQFNITTLAPFSELQPLLPLLHLFHHYTTTTSTAACSWHLLFPQSMNHYSIHNTPGFSPFSARIHTCMWQPWHTEFHFSLFNRQVGDKKQGAKKWWSISWDIISLIRKLLPR